MFVFFVFLMVWSPVKVGALRWADLPFTESYQKSKRCIISDVILIWKRSQGLIGKVDHDDM
jgi:hypothetical protein